MVLFCPVPFFLWCVCMKFFAALNFLHYSSNLQNFLQRQILNTTFPPFIDTKFSISTIFSDISKRNSDQTIRTLSNSEGSKWGRWGWSHFSSWRSLITNPQCSYTYIIFIFMYKNARYRSQFWTDFHEIHKVGAGPPISKTYCFWKQSAQ